jgi:hypothetical protein
LTKEVEFQELEIQLSEKQIKEMKASMNTRSNSKILKKDLEKVKSLKA